MRGRYALANYRQAETQFQSKMKDQAEHNATALGSHPPHVSLAAEDNAFITDGKGEVPAQRNRLQRLERLFLPELEWQHESVLKRLRGIELVLYRGHDIEFIALLFTFDAVSGEKEDKTLTLALANSISRGPFSSGNT